MLKKQKGFTLLEIIIVIIIVGVLAGLAVPRFIRTVQYSESLEALENLSAMRQSLERCGMMNDQQFATDCDGTQFMDVDVPTLGVDGAKFDYAVSGTVDEAAGINGDFTITATNADGDTIWINRAGDKGGTGLFANM